MTNKTWTEQEIKNLIENNDKMVCRSLLKLYNLQTADEKVSQETTIKNGVGFNAVDSGILSSIAEFFIKRGYLSNKQIAIVRKKLYKYVKQLTAIANA